jgi:uncharacterized membrane protein YvbJ
MENKINEKKPVSRKKFLVWGAVFSSVLAIPAFLMPSKKSKPAQTVKMLSQDGNLVEIDISNIPSKKGKLKDKEIHTWVRNKTKHSNS